VRSGADDLADLDADPVQGFDYDGPVRGGESGEVIGVGGLDYAAARFDGHGDGMGVGKEG
jgi:hypothetical protein